MAKGVLAPDIATALPGVRAAAVAWRTQGSLHVTVVAKATFAFAFDAPMPWTEPEEILRAKVDERIAHGGTDVAPTLASADVIFTGSAYVPPHTPVRLALFADQRPLLDKRLLVQPGPFTGLGPDRAVTRQAYQAHEGAIAEIPEGFDWSSLQSAPLDQRTGLLRGDEWIILEGLHPSQPRFRTRLPGARAAAKVHGLEAFGVPEGELLELYADTIRIDGDAQRCSVVWRRSFPVPSEAALAVVRVVAGVAVGDETFSWIEPRAIRQTAPEPAPTVVTRLPETVTLSPEAIEEARRLMALRFRSGPAEPAVSASQGKPEPAPSTGTTTLAPADVEALRAQRALPFEEKAPHVPESAARAPSIASTFEISPEQARAAKAASTLPFHEGVSALAQPEPRSSTEPAEHKSTGTMDLGTLARGPEQAQWPIEGGVFSSGFAGRLPLEGASAPEKLSPWATYQRPDPEDKSHSAAPFFPDLGRSRFVEDEPPPAPDPPPTSGEVTLERCAAIAAELGERRGARAKVLLAHGLTERRWAEAEAKWSRMIARDLDRSDRSRRDAYDDAFVAAWEKVHGPIGAVHYARLNEAEPGELEDLLEGLKIQRTVWMRLRRVWRRRLENEAEIEASADCKPSPWPVPS